ncbi:MAG: sigma-54 dependent transcriptional regulator [Bacteroidales bacterium]|nr:sigma-54 dependent transcriptional regulator [Bacteroidales bacterium]
MHLCNILVCDDDLAVRSSLKFLLSKSGYGVDCASSPDEILSKVRLSKFSLVLLDMNYSMTISGDEGLELLQKIRVLQPGLPVILITAWGSVELAVQGMKLGASDFIIKPWNNQQLLKTIETSIALSKTQTDSDKIDMPKAGKTDFPGIIGQYPKLLEILQLVSRVAPTHAPVLITGESGTGKELIAEAIHQLSKRKEGPFIKINLGGISSSLFESELFGHKRGAFTDAKTDRTGRFEMANNGTIFLDEIGELELTSQVKLLRVLQDQTFERLGDSHTQTVDVRVISATNKDLNTLVEKGLFREDLFYRINLIQIEVPPLRKRKEDIPLLASWFAEQAAKAYHLPVRQFAPDSLEWLREQSWPGNIRELKNTVERTILLSNHENITADDCILAVSNGKSQSSVNFIAGPLKTLDEMEKEMVLRALDECGENLTKVSQMLGISRTTLYRKMEKYDIRKGHEE